MAEGGHLDVVAWSSCAGRQHNSGQILDHTPHVGDVETGAKIMKSLLHTFMATDLKYAPSLCKESAHRLHSSVHLRYQP